jgi:3-methylcrotonyl-CoA carboxylase alpha subunit
MPGVLAEMRVQVGTIVDAGEIVAVLESMKLFLDLRSPIAGVVARVVVAKGQTIGGGDLVMTIDPAAPSGAAPPDAPPRR